MIKILRIFTLILFSFLFLSCGKDLSNTAGILNSDGIKGSNLTEVSSNSEGALFAALVLLNGRDRKEVCSRYGLRCPVSSEISGLMGKKVGKFYVCHVCFINSENKEQCLEGITSGGYYLFNSPKEGCAPKEYAVCVKFVNI